MILSPSLLSADFSRLAEELDKARASNEVIATPFEDRSRHRFDGMLRWPD